MGGGDSGTGFWGVRTTALDSCAITILHAHPAGPLFLNRGHEIRAVAGPGTSGDGWRRPGIGGIVSFLLFPSSQPIIVLLNEGVARVG